MSWCLRLPATDLCVRVKTNKSKEKNTDGDPPLVNGFNLNKTGNAEIIFMLWSHHHIAMWYESFLFVVDSIGKWQNKSIIIDEF